MHSPTNYSKMPNFVPNTEELIDEPVVHADITARVVALNALHTKQLDRHFLPHYVNTAEWQLTGLWILPSYIDHSCLSNCSTFYIGDALFIGAKTYSMARNSIDMVFEQYGIPDLLVFLNSDNDTFKDESFLS